MHSEDFIPLESGAPDTPLFDYPAYEDIEGWQALFPFEDSLKLMDLKSKKFKIEVELEKLSSSTSEVVEAEKVLQDISSGGFLRLKNAELDAFFEDVLRNLKEPNRFKQRYWYRNVFLQSQFLIHNLRSMIYDATRKSLENDDSTRLEYVKNEMYKLMIEIQNDKRERYQKKLDELKEKENKVLNDKRNQLTIIDSFIIKEKSRIAKERNTLIEFKREEIRMQRRREKVSKQQEILSHFGNRRNPISLNSLNEAEIAGNEVVVKKEAPVVDPRKRLFSQLSDSELKRLKTSYE